MSDILMKIEDAAKFLGRSPHSVKDYAQIMESKGRKFLRGNKNEYKFSDEDINLIRKAISLQRQDRLPKMQAIEQVLLESGDISNSPNLTEKSNNILDLSNIPGSISDLSNALSNMSRNVLDMSTKISDMTLKIEQLQMHNIEQSKAYESKISELSNKLEAAEIGKLRDSMREVKEIIVSQQEAAASKEESNRKSFFSRLFGKRI